MNLAACANARHQFEVNLFGLARLTQLLLPKMRGKGAGKMINITSMGGKIYTSMGAWRHASKHALEVWSDCLRLELAAFGIDVVIVEPGVIKTEFGDVLMDPLRKRSGESAYAKLAQNVAQATKRSYETGGALRQRPLPMLFQRRLRRVDPKHGMWRVDSQNRCCLFASGWAIASLIGWS